MQMIPNAILLEKKELEDRLNWIESEILQLSNSKGVGERIQKLQIAVAPPRVLPE